MEYFENNQFYVFDVMTFEWCENAQVCVDQIIAEDMLEELQEYLEEHFLGVPTWEEVNDAMLHEYEDIYIDLGLAHLVD